jgi:hypothetical protein
MSRQSNLAQTSAIACTLSLLLSSTAWAAVANIHITVPVIHPKVPVVIVKPNVPHIAITTGIDGQSAEGNVTQPYIIGSQWNAKTVSGNLKLPHVGAPKPQGGQETPFLRYQLTTVEVSPVKWGHSGGGVAGNARIRNPNGTRY